MQVSSQNSHTIRPYQAEMRLGILRSWASHRSCLAVLPTGGGKTMVAAATTESVQHTGGKTLFLANRNELCVQPMAAFARQGLIPALEKAESIAPLESRVVIASVQTLSRQKRLDRFPRDHFKYIFCDEAHMSVAPSWLRILNHFSEAKICGITATPFRSDAKSLSAIYEEEAYRKELYELTDEGWLVAPDHVDKLSTAISLAQVRVKRTAEGLDYDVTEAASAIEPYFEEIAKELKEKHASRHILAFLPLVASSQKFVAACVAAGINAVHVDGEDSERDVKLAAFRDGQITLLSNANLLHTGVDIPLCDATLNLRPTKSKVLYQQIIGRSTRTLPGTIDNIDEPETRLAAIRCSAKPISYIIDPLWLSAEHDLCSPAFLIAPNEQFAEEMNAKAGQSYSLRQLSRQIQQEREEVIRRRLERVASFREGKIDAEYFAAATHETKLQNYEPVYLWECAPVRPFTRLLLERDGIDPDTVGSEGLAIEIEKAIGRRKNRGLCEIRELADFADAGLEDLWNLKKGKHAFYSKRR